MQINAQQIDFWFWLTLNLRAKFNSNELKNVHATNNIKSYANLKDESSLYLYISLIFTRWHNEGKTSFFIPWKNIAIDHHP